VSAYDLQSVAISNANTPKERKNERKKGRAKERKKGKEGRKKRERMERPMERGGDIVCVLERNRERA
jgi:hypothetical protein